MKYVFFLILLICLNTSTDFWAADVMSDEVTTSLMTRDVVTFVISCCFVVDDTTTR